MSSQTWESLSVIVNIYNVDSFLAECVDSILAQTVLPGEIILVDDGSRDSCAKICLDYKNRYPSLVKCVLLKDNMGLVHGRKTGIRNSVGSEIAFVDGDDWLDETRLEELHSIFLETNADIVAAGHKEDLLGRITPGRNLIRPGFYSGDELVQSVFPHMLNTGECSRFGIYTYLWNKVFKRAVVKDVVLRIDERIAIGEDACGTYPALLRSNSVAVSDADGYHYRQRGGSMMKDVSDGREEYQKLHALAQYLLDDFSLSSYKSVLLPQLKMYMLSQMVIRTDGLNSEIAKENPLFPFKSIPPDSTIALHGAGTFGQQMYRKIVSNSDYRLVVWSDVAFEEYAALGMPVVAPKALLRHEFDYLLVAYADEIVRADEMAKLRKLGISESKIKLIELTEEEKDDLFSQLDVVL